MTPTLTHLALHVRDLEACVAFYRDFCGMSCVHERADAAGGRVVWLAEPGRETEFILVVLAGGPGRDQGERAYSHFGFALESRAAVDAIARLRGHPSPSPRFSYPSRGGRGGGRRDPRRDDEDY